MASNKDIERMQMVIAELHGCDSKHVMPVAVHEVFEGRTVWKGVVEVFDLIGHPKAKRCYAWSHSEGEDDSGERFVTVLEIPPVGSAETAVKASIVRDFKRTT